MSQRIVVNDSNGLAELKDILLRSVAGEFGDINEVRVVINDDGTMMIGANGMLSHDFGETSPTESKRDADIKSRLNKLERFAKALAPQTFTQV